MCSPDHRQHKHFLRTRDIDLWSLQPGSVLGSYVDLLSQPPKDSCSFLSVLLSSPPLYSVQLKKLNSLKDINPIALLKESLSMFLVVYLFSLFCVVNTVGTDDIWLQVSLDLGSIILQNLYSFTQTFHNAVSNSAHILNNYLQYSMTIKCF